MGIKRTLDVYSHYLVLELMLHVVSHFKMKYPLPINVHSGIL